MIILPGGKLHKFSERNLCFSLSFYFTYLLRDTFFFIILSVMKPSIDIAELGTVWQQSYSLNNTKAVGQLLCGFVFYLDADKDNRVYLHLKNRNGKNVPFSSLFLDYKPLFTVNDSPSYVLYSCIEAACRQHTSLLSWTAEAGSALYLDENDTLAESLFASGCPVYFGNGKKPLAVSFSGDKSCSGRLLLEIQEQQPEYSGTAVYIIRPVFRTDDGLHLCVQALSSRFLAADNVVYRCSDAGAFYNRLASFSGSTGRKELEQCLSLFASFFPKIGMFSSGWQYVELPPQHVERALQFRGLDGEGNLCLSFRWYHEPLDTSFISDNKPVSVIRINDEAHRIERYNLLYNDADITQAGVEQLLKTTAKEHADELDAESTQYMADGKELYVSAALALPFLTEHLSDLVKSYRLFGTDTLSKYKLRTVSPKTTLRLSTGIDFFDTKCTVDIAGQAFTLGEAYRQYEEHSYIALSDGTRAIIDPEYFVRLKQLLGRESKNGDYKLSFFDLPLIDSLIDAKIEGDGTGQCREVYEGFNTINERTLPATALNGRLRDYQKYGAKWLSYLSEHNLGGCLADDMGLGKTIQTISLLASAYEGSGTERLSSLVVMPKSLIANWQEELIRFAPELDVYIYYGVERNLPQALQHQVILTTYALVRNDIEELQKTTFDYIILDEVQAIKNSSSQASKSAVLLNGRHRFALSGTPMENNVGELYSLFRFLNPAMFGTVAEFNRKFLGPIQKNGDIQSAKDLGTKIRPFILRRLKQDVAKELPERTEQVCFVDMSGEQAQLYERQRRFYQEIINNEIAQKGFEKSTFSILQALLELRQLATVPESKTDGEVVSAKWDVLIDHISEITESGHRCLVFSNFLASLDAVSQRLESQNTAHLVMTGATANRAELVRKFQQDETYKVFLMTLKTGGVGLNLTGADYVYILDPWWNRSAEQQAIDRTHRIGQTKNVFCYRLIARNTIEEKILELQQKKADLCASVIATDSQMMKKLTSDDINYLLREEYRG
jgi:superfamily II DNA or RNA helicase